MIYNLVDKNDPILKQKMEPFDFSNPAIDPVELAFNLAETMLESNGIGIAANQCGLPYRVFIIKGIELIPCFNPRIVDVSEENIVLEEGCLTYPGMFVKIKRPRRIKVRYSWPTGNVVTQVFEGMTARVFMHELDHLDGVVHTTRASKIHLEQARNQMKKIKRKNK